MKEQVSEIKISYKNRLRSDEWHKVKSSSDAASIIYQNWNRDTIAVQEAFKILLLNNANKVKGIFEVSKGGITGTTVDLRLLFAVILKALSTAIILTHNHPSGNLTPSGVDKSLTKKIKEAADLFDVRVLDHIILSPEGDYFSFADEQLL